MKTQDIVAGALVDFVAFLTKRCPAILVGSSAESPPVQHILREFAERRGINLKGAAFDWEKETHKGSSYVIKTVESSPSKPVVRIVWGDDVVTYAHFTEEAEIIHMAAREAIVERLGKATPEEAIAS